MSSKVVLTTGLSEQQAEGLLQNGALIVFGDQFLDVATGLSKQGLDVPILAGPRVADLKLPDTLMLFGMMVFAHTLPGPKGKAATQADLAAWKDKLFDRVDFVAGKEPMPAAEFSLTEGTRDVITQLTWAPPASGDWQGVRSGQLRRIASQFEARYDRAQGSGQTVLEARVDRPMPSRNVEPKVPQPSKTGWVWLLVLAALIGGGAYLYATGQLPAEVTSLFER